MDISDVDRQMEVVDMRAVDREVEVSGCYGRGQTYRGE